MRKLAFLALVMWLTIPCQALAAVTIQDFVDVPVPAKMSGEPRTIDEVRAAILESCALRGWTAVDEPNNRIRASILVRGKHYAEIDIPYSPRSYSIYYKSSRNLDYNEAKRKIHRNYHRWIVKLSGTIQKQLGVRTQSF